jgi:GH3 auxin-responsive promoter
MLKAIFNTAVSSYLTWRYKRIELMIKQGRDFQKSMLDRFLIEGRMTEYGRKNSFKNIKNYDTFSKETPVTTYEDIFDDIQSMMKGKPNVLWPGKVDWFAKSSGTTSNNSKFIPVSDRFFENNLMASSWDTTTLLYQMRPDCKTFERKNLTMCGSISKISEYPDAHVGDVSAIMVEKMPLIGRPFITPDTETNMISNWEEKLDKVCKKVIHEDVVMIGGVPTWLIVLFDKMLEYTGKDNILEIWPNLTTYLHGGVGFCPYIKTFQKYIPKSDFDYVEVYNASEGCFAVQDTNVDPNGMLLLLNNDIFYEFILLSDFHVGKMNAIPIWEVSIGVHYVLVITTSSGLWRYMPGDTIAFTTIQPYRIKVTGRTKSFINAFGEEVMVGNTDTAVKIVADQHNAIVSEYTVAPHWLSNNSKGRHDWLIEFEVAPHNIAQFETDLDLTVQKLNSDYEAKRSKNLALEQLSIKVVPKGTFLRWLHTKGKSGGQNKVPRLFNDRTIVESVCSVL